MFEVETTVTSYHIHKDMWDAHINEGFLCVKEPGSFQDASAIAIVKLHTT